MYNYEWDSETGGYVLTTIMSGITRQLRPVFYEELELLGFNKYWRYTKTDKPLLWAQTRRYIYKGRLVAEVNSGGLYTSPDVKVHENDLELQPVDVTAMIAKNKPLHDGVVQSTLETIYRIFKEYKAKKIDVFYVAFSGGKDSLVLLDLVQRALPHNEFKVVFSDTTMEVPDTYVAVELAKKRWPTLEFHTSKSHMDAKETWELFGPPSRTQRWCCGVHKSAPAILLLRQLVGKADLKALVFDGVRAEESDSRSGYSLVSDGDKHVTQVNCHTLLDWNTAELYLYILENDLLLNNAYRYGAIRVGCSMCPMASSWWEYIANSVYHECTHSFVDIIDNNAKQKFSVTADRIKYLNTGGWKGRVAGRYLNIGDNGVIEQYDGKMLTMYILGKHADWREWIKTIGDVVSEGNNNYSIKYKNYVYIFNVEEVNNVLKVSIENYLITKDSIRFIYLFKNVYNKAAYCVRCKVCMVECKHGALNIDSDRVSVHDTCKHCESCLDKKKGCLAAKSLHVSEGRGNMSLKGIDRYRHFGFRKEWLEYFIDLGNDKFWSCGKLGKYQFDGFKVWLKESGITSSNSITPLGTEIVRLGANDIRGWAIIFNNLVYSSTIVRWYVQSIDFGIEYKIIDIITMLGDNHSISTRENAVMSLKETFKTSPIGIELGVGVYELKGKAIMAVTRTAWREPDPVVILYSLYKFAEAGDGYYSFTLTELINDNRQRAGISPARIFGIGKDQLKQIVQGLAIDYPDFIGAAFNKDLDNINLRKEKTLPDVLKLL
ncbi:phosphoadenosine phosphosulfate reductase family protein [Candidatus Magnetominusculus xianensis]|uniref:Phosphoadenosine phosphosulfate reductase n=1 Tax=Candidatus Magnetominusculus xianensis TaxID=1748249 RepID=A0ABR5SCJ3_9BACT|nr:phosphoadenosine phosphosulfate reductase family protein [Candidatus Magnetominusculus xianensis]KWT75633.1 phosphoadenosine phosphosulfate reductase [Candidatus Magnetominusculus xianensis]MBF0403716.1 phosphoadenosine phosphosulfate reductase family protein [Nitrospirota bacterium]